MAEMEFPFHIREHLIPTQHIREYARATANSQNDVHYLAVKQYIPKDNPDPQPGDVTILGAHANGFPKELYEPLWADLHAALSVLPGPRRLRIRAIWIADVANQGYSGTANEQSLGNDPSWADHPRDLLHLTNVFRDQMPRPIVGVGHSFGAATLVGLSLLHPRLLETLVLFDATIVKFGFRSSGPGVSPAKGSAFRRETWPSAQAAAEAFRKSGFYRGWDPRVLDAWIEHGIRKTPTALFPGNDGDGKREGGADGTVTLRTTKHQELFTFFRPLYPYIDPQTGGVDRARVPDFDPDAHEPLGSGAQVPFPFYRSEGPTMLRRLPEVRPSVLFVAGGASDLSAPNKRRVRLETCGTGPGGSGGRERERVDEVVLEGRGHLFPMEVPQECATHAAKWIGKEMERWRREEQEFEAWSQGKTLREKCTMDEEWYRRLGGPPERKGNGAKL